MKDSGNSFHARHLKRALDYVMNPEKTQRGRLVGAINCQADMAFEQMMDTKKQFGKTDKRQGYHIILSFKEDEVEPDRAFEITQKFVAEYLGDAYEAVFVVHDNTDHVHSHIVFNSVSFVDGKKYRYENANKESWIYSTKIKSEVIQMLDQFMCCSEKKVRFSDAFCAVAANYMVLMLMDSLSGYRKMFNTYCINSSLEIKNKSFYGLKLGADAFRKVKEDYVRIDESVTEAEALNRFIVKSKDIIDMNFEYEFKNDGNINRVITRVKDKEVIEAEGKNELLLDAAKESVTETIIKLFQSYGVKVSLALGFDEIKRLFASEKSVYAFDDKGIFSKEGVLIFRVD